jgi:hypothetical protein
VTLFDFAQICMNGHVINSVAGQTPAWNRKFCGSCGAKTITQCFSRQSPIRGEPRVSWMASDAVPPYTCPSFCKDCGSPYPWTQSKLVAARELIELSDDIEASDKEILVADLPDLARETPKTKVAAIRFRKIAFRLGGSVASALRDIAVVST